MSNAPDPVELAGLARAVASDAAAFLHEGLGRARALVETKSTTTDMVTEMDRASEARIVAALRAERPGDGFLGEEGASEPGTTGVRWVIDPLDGTTNYLYGFPGFNVSIAAELDGVVIAAAVVDPLHGDLFSAARGHGALRNDRQVTVSDEDRLTHALIATGFGYDPGRRARQAEVLARVIAQVRDVRRMGAAAVDLCSVACGRLDGYYERGLGPWDLAAGWLIATEAGAVVSDLAGGPPSGDYVVAAPPALHEPLLELLNTAGAEGV